MDREGLLSLYMYNTYANRLVLDVVEKMDEAALRQETSPSRGSAYRLLRHYLVAEAYFLAACRGTEFQVPDLPSLTAYRPAYEIISRELEEFIGSLDPSDVDRPTTIHLFERDFTFPLWKLLTQAFVHSTTHRGELSILLSQLGHPLPNMDIIVHFAAESGQSWPVSAG